MSGLRVLDLFSGIGGFSLGLERAGMQTIAFCEIDPKARLVLAKHWPNVPIYEDVTTLKGDHIEADVICGGFPCQDISVAGRGAGLAGARSGLWFQFHRLIDEIRPRYAIIENVSALRSRGLDTVLGSLAAIGYDAEWHCIPASAVGAPHRRDRVWIIAYPQCTGRERPFDYRGVLSRALQAQSKFSHSAFGEWHALARGERTIRSCDGVPVQMERNRLKQLGNAVVPQIPELIGRVIMATLPQDLFGRPL